MGDAGDLGALLSEGEDVLAANDRQAEPAGASHELLQTDFCLPGKGKHRHRSEWDVLEVASVLLLDLLVVEEDLLHRGSVLGDGLGKVLVLEPLVDVLPEHSRNHESATHADSLEVG